MQARRVFILEAEPRRRGQLKGGRSDGNGRGSLDLTAGSWDNAGSEEEDDPSMGSSARWRSGEAEACPLFNEETNSERRKSGKEKERPRGALLNDSDPPAAAPWQGAEPTRGRGLGEAGPAAMTKQHEDDGNEALCMGNRESLRLEA